MLFLNSRPKDISFNKISGLDVVSASVLNPRDLEVMTYATARNHICFRTTDIAEPLCFLVLMRFDPNHANKTANFFEYTGGFDSSIIITSRNSGIFFSQKSPCGHYCEREIIVHINLRPFAFCLLNLLY